MGVCHRDIKLQNLVLDSEFNLKLIDFGMACDISGQAGTGFSQECLGTRNYMAPEIIGQVSYQPVLADLFALGVILFIMHTGREPFEQASKEDQLYKLIMLNKFELFWSVHENAMGAPLSSDFKDLMQNMLAFQPYQRLNMVDVVVHPFLT